MGMCAGSDAGVQAIRAAQAMATKRLSCITTLCQPKGAAAPRSYLHCAPLLAERVLQRGFVADSADRTG